MAVDSRTRGEVAAADRTPEPRRDHRPAFWVLAVLLLGLPTVTLPPFGPWLAVKAFAMELGAIILAVTALSRGEWSGSRVRSALLQPLNLVILGFVGWIAISAALSSAPARAPYEVMRHLGGALLYFGVLYGLSRRRGPGQLVRLIAVVGSLAAVASFLNAGEGEIERVAGAFHNQQLLAGFLCLVLPLVMAGAAAEPDDNVRLGLRVAVVIIGAGLLVTQNRSAWLGIGVALVLMAGLYWLWGRERGRPLQKGQLIIPVLVVALTVGLFLGMSRLSGSLSRRAVTLSALARDESFRWRLGMWDKAVRMLRDRPWSGWGPGSFALQQALYPHPEVPFRTQIDIARSGATLDENAHNTFLQLGAETGAPGLLLWCGLYFAFVWTALRALRRGKPGFRQALLIGAVGAVAAQGISSFGSPAWEFAECSAFFWVVLALGMLAAGASDPDAGGAQRSRN
jgi:O-antigen ligase